MNKYELSVSKILKLTVKEPWFTLMEKESPSGDIEKDIEVRDPSDWIKARLCNKDGSPRHYDFVHVVNGYGIHRPSFMRTYEGFGTGYDVQYTFSNNQILKVKPEQFVIFLGKVVERKNIKS